MLSAARHMSATELQQERTLVVGLGETGASVVRYLVRQGVEVAVTDSRAEPPRLAALREALPEVPLFVGGFAADAFARAGRIVVSPGVSLDEPLIREARARGVEIIGDVELFARAARAPVIAITGSNGKSTVTTLVGRMAQCAGRDVRIGGNLGTPALDLLGDAEPDLYVLELSSFQLETVSSLRAQAACILNISVDHLDRYASLDDYAAAKAAIYRGCRHAVVNRDDARVLALAGDWRPQDSFGLSLPPAEGGFGLDETGDEAWLVQGDRRLLPAAQVRMPGRHNLANALAALALGQAAGLPMPAMLETLRSFAGLPHRTQWVAEVDGVRWYNDSKATNVGAALAAIQGIPGPLVLIAGGQGKGADFRELAHGMQGRVRAAVLIGEDAPRLAAFLQGQVPFEQATDMDDAVARARALARPGDAVLLSPACASFDMFDGFAARGEAFMQAVGRLTQQ